VNECAIASASWSGIDAGAVMKCSAIWVFWLTFIGLTIAAALQESSAQSQLVAGSGFVEEVILSELPPATSVAFGPQGRLYVALKEGIIRVAQNGTLLSTPFIDISAITNRRTDRGLGGIALDPQFPARPYVYLFFTYDPPELPADDITPRVSRLVRVQADAAKNYNVALPGTMEVVLGRNSIAAHVAPTIAQGTTILPEPASCMMGLTMDGSPIEDCIPSDELSHSAGSLIFGADGYLYASHGDGSSYSGATKPSLRSQMLDSLAGKVIRIDPNTGAGVPGNPFYDPSNPSSNRSRVWSYGLRNPFRITLNSATGQVYLGDVGTSAWEEVNSGKGVNHGWPCYEGGNTTNDPVGTGSTVSLINSAFQNLSRTAPFCADLYKQGLGAVVAPLFSYRHPVDANGKDLGGSVTGVAFYAGSTYPAKYRGALFIADYAQHTIRYLTFDSRGVPTVNPFATEISPSGGPVQLLIGPDTNLYGVFLDLVTRKSQVRRYRYTGSSNTPPTVVLKANPIGGSVPLAVTFDTTGTSDADGQSLTYSWDFGDGSGSAETSANPVHIYQTVGTFEATVTVRETTAPFAESMASVIVRTGVSPPKVRITAPTADTTYAIGDTIQFSGYAEFDGVRVPASSLTWTILQRHNLHEHLVDEITGVASGSFEAGEHSDNTRYVVCLLASAGDGLDDQACTVVNPKITDTTFLSDPIGAQMTYVDEEVQVLTPYTAHPVQNSQQTLVADALHQGRSFFSWDDGLMSRERSFFVGGQPASFKALYRNLPPTAIISAPALAGVAPFAAALSAAASNDPEGTALLYRWSFGAGDTASAVSVTRTFSVPGRYPVTLRVTDALGHYAETVSTIVVFESTAINTAPAVVAPLPQAVRLGRSFSLNGTLFDDGLPIGSLTSLWSRVRGPSGLTFSSPTMPSTAATASTIGTYLVKLEGNDSLLRSSQNTLVTVNPSQSAFAVTSLSLIDAATDQVVPGYEAIRNGAVIPVSALGTTAINVRANTQGAGVGSVVFLQDAVASSSDDNAPYSIEPSTSVDLPAWPYTRKRYLVTAVPYALAGGKGLQGDGLSVAFTLSGTAITNTAPSAVINRSLSAGTPPLTVRFDGSASTDPQRDPLTYFWDLGSGASSTNAVVSRTFTAPGTYAVTLTVRDPSGFSSTATTAVTVGDPPTPTPTFTPTATPTATRTPTATPTNTPAPVNLAPVVDIGLAQTVVSGAPLTLRGTVTDDGRPTGILQVLWSKVRGPGTLSFLAPTSVTTGVTASSVGTYLVKLEASDTVLRSSRNGVVTINPTNATFGVSSLSLINAATGEPFSNYALIPDGTVINLSDLGASPQINIRANLAGAGVASVQWMLDATPVSIDNTGPFSIAPSTASAYPAWAYSKQLYRMTAVPYSGVNASGVQGAALSIQFVLR
jgi:glucose/arabinose dehydrogenase/PKD repeat protein